MILPPPLRSPVEPLDVRHVLLSIPLPRLLLVLLLQFGGILHIEGQVVAEVLLEEVVDQLVLDGGLDLRTRLVDVVKRLVVRGGVLRLFIAVLLLVFLLLFLFVVIDRGLELAEEAAELLGGGQWVFLLRLDITVDDVPRLVRHLERHFLAVHQLLRQDTDHS